MNAVFVPIQMHKNPSAFFNLNPHSFTPDSDVRQNL